jgi:uncharacterized protein (DUF433 family)/DNA-binding transcriptional regulator YiaG
MQGRPDLASGYSREIAVAKLQFDAGKIAEFSDAREMPAYGIPQAAHYLQIPAATLRSWAVGRDYPTGRGKKRFRPIISLPDKSRPLLSFFNLAEAHVLSALRRDHRIRLQDIRSALKYIQNELGSTHPLLDQRFETDGVALFVTRLGKLVDVSAAGQLVMRGILSAYLKRLEREDLVVARLYPFTRSRETDGPKLVLIDPRHSFGRPVLARARIATAVIAERYKAGESIDDLADDYACERLEVDEALRCELSLEAA